jgi:hypothetical protein
MKLKATLLAASAFLCCTSFAQSGGVNKELIQHTIRESLQEKIRSAPVKISDMLAATERSMAKSTAGPDGKLSSMSALAVDEAEVHIAINPMDSNMLVVSYMQQTTSGLIFPIYYSSDGGLSWARSSFNPGVILNADFPGQFVMGGGDPAFAWSKTGTLYYSWIYLTTSAAQDTGFVSMYLATSTDGGASFSVAPGLQHFIGQGGMDLTNSGMFNFKEGFFDRQWLAVDNSNGPNAGTLYASFLLMPADNNFSKFGTSLRKKAPGASFFGPITTIFNGQGQFSNVAVDDNGKVMVSFADEGADVVYQATSTNAGASFSVHQVAQADRLAGVQAGTNFVHNRENGATSMAVDGAGNIHMVWTSFPSSGVEAYYAMSRNSGASWSTPVNLNTWFPGRNAFMPTVAASGNNVTISVTAVGSDDSSFYYQAYSDNNGQSFGTPVVVSSIAANYKAFSSGASNHFFGDYNSSVRTSCYSYSAWSDARPHQGAKLYIARSNICATGVPEISSVTGNVQLQRIYPNPATTAFTLQISAASAATVTAILNDMTGRNVASKNASLHPGNQTLTLSVNGVAAGNYVLSIHDKSGLITTRFVQVK